MYVVHPPKYGPNSVQRSIPSSIQAWQKSALVGSGKNRLQWNKAVPPFPKSKCPPKTAGGYSPIRVRMDRVEQYSSIQWYHYSTFFIHILPQKIGKFHSTGGGNCTMTKSGEKYTTENGVARQDGFKDGDGSKEQTEMVILWWFMVILWCFNGHLMGFHDGLMVI